MNMISRTFACLLVLLFTVVHSLARWRACLPNRSLACLLACSVARSLACCFLARVLAHRLACLLVWLLTRWIVNLR